MGKDIYISLADHEQHQDEEVRLLHLFNVKLGKEDLFTSLENKEVQ